MRYSIFLKENYEIFVQMLDKIRAEIMIIDDRDKVVIANHAICRRTGLLRKDIEGVAIEDLAEKGSVISPDALKAIYSYEEKSTLKRVDSREYRVISCFPLFYQGAVDLVVYINKGVNGVGETETPSKKDIAAKNDRYRQKLLKTGRKNKLIKEPVYDMSLGLEDMLDQYEKQILLHALEECGTMTAAARKLQVNKSTVSRKIKKHDIKL